MNRLDNYIKQVRGISYNPADISEVPLENYLPILKANNIQEDGLDISNLIYIHKSKIREEQLIRKGDLLLAASSGSKDIVGKNVFFEEDFKGSFGAFCKVIRPNRNIYPKFLSVFFKTPAYKRHIRNLIQGANINNLKNEDIDSLKIPEFSPEDQVKIAKVLILANNLIKHRKESINLLEEFLKSTFWELFGDVVKNEKGWEVVPLNNFGDIITGNTPPRNDLDNYSTDFIEWIKTDNIEKEHLYITKASEYLSRKGLAKSRFVEKGALLVACIAGSIESVGRAGLTNRKVSFNQQINAIQPNEEINSFFLYWLFKNSKSYIQNHATKGMKKILTKGEFEKILMIKPPITLQNQFGLIVEKAEVVKNRYQQSLYELENLYGSLSQRAFNGALDLSKVTIDIENIIPENSEDKRYGDPFEGIEDLPEDGLFGEKEMKKLRDKGWEIITPENINKMETEQNKSAWERYEERSGESIEDAVNRFASSVEEDSFEKDITKMSLDDWYRIPYEIREQYGSIEDREFDWEFFLRKHFSDRPITTDEVAHLHYVYQSQRGYDFSYEEFAEVIFEEIKKNGSYLTQKFNPETKQIELKIDEAAKTKIRYAI